MSVLSKLVKAVNCLLPLRNCIVFESCPDLSDNTKAVFDELINRKFNNQYKMIWLVDERKASYPQVHNVHYVNKISRTKLDALKMNYYLQTSKCLISCNRSIGSERENQVSFYLTHGTPIKTVRAKYHVADAITYVLVASPNVRELYAYEKHIDINKVYALGYPRNDELTNGDKNSSAILNCKYRKVIVWYPTYRQNKSKDGITLDTNAIPIIHDKISAEKVNSILVEHNILLVLKPHFAQDISFFQELALSNIKFIDDTFFWEHSVSSYSFVGGCDALITDYSSIYYDFTLCDKPIAAVWEDIEEYKKQQGFAVDIDYVMRGAEKIYTVNDLVDFIVRVSKGIDILKKERNEIKQYANYADDGKNTQRVVDFIIQKANL